LKSPDKMMMSAPHTHSAPSARGANSMVFGALKPEDVAQEVTRVHQTLVFHDWVELKAAKSELELTMRRPTPELLSWPATVSIVMQAFVIGDLGITAIPFETFTETGLEIKARSLFKDTADEALSA